MPTTNIEGPNSHAAAGTIDSVSFSALGQPQRVLESTTGANAAFLTSGNRGTRYFNCFNSSQIPSDATITGMEIVAGVDFDGSGNSNFGTFGSSGGSANVTAKVYLHNGTDYSSALTLDNSVAATGVAFNGDNTEVTFTGANKRYLGISTLGTLAGSSTSLSGLSFSPDDQANFGFAIVFTTVDSGGVAGVIRGIGLRATYELPPADPRPTYNNSTAMISVDSGNITVDLGNVKIGI